MSKFDHVMWGEQNSDIVKPKHSQFAQCSIRFRLDYNYGLRKTNKEHLSVTATE